MSDPNDAGASPEERPESARPTARYGKAPVAEGGDMESVEAGAFGSSAMPALDGDTAPPPEDDGETHLTASPENPATRDLDPETRDFDEESFSPEDVTAAYGQDTLAGLEARRRLGDFELVRQIGQGGMGEVWLANQVSLDRPVAVKLLPKTLASQENFIERFQREAKAAASLVHPNVIQIYAYGIEDGTPYFAMEYVEGEDAQQRMRREGGLDPREIAEIMLGTGAALQAAHEKGLIHRDIKPSNIMIDKAGLVKVMDFGLAKATSGGAGAKTLTSAGLIMGTPNYLSPEQGRGDPLDGRSDLYSLGVVLYEMLTGEVPFRADTPAGLIFKHVYEPPPPPQEIRPEIPPFLVDITLKLLEKDPDDRYANAGEFMADLAEFLENLPYYEGGGERRPGAGAEDPERVQASGVHLLTGARRKLDSERRKAASGARHAVTEPISGEEARRKVAPRSRPPRSEREVRDVRAAEDAARPIRPPPAVVVEDRPSGGRGLLWTVVVLLLLAGAGYGVHLHDPTVLPGVMDRLGLVQPTPGGGGPGGDPSPDPTGDPNGGTGPVTTADRPGGADVAFVYTRSVGAGVTITLDGGRKYVLEPGERASYAPGVYDLSYTRRGYGFTIIGVRLVDAGDGRGVLELPDGGDATAVPVEWIATPELSEPYAEGRRLFEAGRLAEARVYLDQAAEIDRRYRPAGEPDAPTVQDLLDRIRLTEQGEDAIDAAFAKVDETLGARRWRAARDLLEGLEGRRPEAYGPRVARIEEGLEHAADLRSQFAAELDEGDHEQAADRLDTLAEHDPDSPELSGLRAELAAAVDLRAAAFAKALEDPSQGEALLETYLAKFPGDRRARERLGELEADTAAETKLAEMRRLIQAERWADVVALADEVAALDDLGPRSTEEVARLRRRAQEELDVAAIRSSFGRLDAGLESGDVDAVLRLLDRDAEPDAYAAEKRALEAFFAEDGVVRGRFVESAHELHREDVALEADTATVAAQWTFAVEFLDRPVARFQRVEHVVELRRAADGWSFAGFRVPEGESLRAPR